MTEKSRRLQGSWEARSRVERKKCGTKVSRGIPSFLLEGKWDMGATAPLSFSLLR